MLEVKKDEMEVTRPGRRRRMRKEGWNRWGRRKAQLWELEEELGLREEQQ